MSLSSFSLASIRNQLDEVRAQVYPKNETERKVYEALSSKNWGASSTLMNDIATESMDYEKFGIIMTIIWNSLDVDGRSWKQIFKTLTLIEFLIKNGSERVIEASRDRMHKIRSLETFTYEEANADKGAGVREKSKQLVELLQNNEMIRSEREKARQIRSKFVGISNEGRNSGFGAASAYGGHGGGSSYDSYSSGRYSDNHNSNSSTWTNSGGDNSTGRYNGGGDSYDSNRPSRYNEDSQSLSNASSSLDRDHREKHKSNSHDDDHDEKKPSKFSGGVTGKLKVAMKKVDPKKSPTKAELSKPIEVDLFSFDSEPVTNPAHAPPSVINNPSTFDPFGAAPSQSAAPPLSTPVFDPFAQAPAPAPVQPLFAPAFTQAPLARSTDSFDPFGTSAPAPPVPAHQQQQQFGSSSFDPFGHSVLSPNPTPAPVMPTPQLYQPQYQSTFSQQPTMMSPRLQPHSSLQPLQQQTPVMMQTASTMAPSPVKLTIPNNSSNRAAAPAATDFGDFESANNTSTSKKDASNKWGDLGKLVDLNGISKNESKVATSASANGAGSNGYSQSSFAGLDGFSKPQSMTQASGPMGLSTLSAYPPVSGQPVMMVRQPAPQPMGMSVGYPTAAPVMPGYPPAPMQGGMGGMPAMYPGQTQPQQPAMGMGTPSYYPSQPMQSQPGYGQSQLGYGQPHYGYGQQPIQPQGFTPRGPVMGGGL